MGTIRTILILLVIQNCFSQVGIGTTNPQQTLHIASSTNSLRVESLNSTNNSFNGGGTINYPLYVDDKGDFTLLFRPLLNSEDLDAFNDAELPNSDVSLSPFDWDGIASTVIDTRTITVTRPSVLELKYNISYDVYLNAFQTKITDGLARRIETYITVLDATTGVEQTRKYGPTSKCYTSSSMNSVSGIFYNSCTTYITLPDDNHTYIIKFNGAISSDIRGGNSGNLSEPTYVKFATGDDFIFARLH